MTVIEAYLDESGTHKGAEMLCVAGYIGNRKQWYSFEKEWQKKLKDSGMASFHAKEQQCNILKSSLISAIERHDLIGFIISVRPDTYDLHAGPHFKSNLGNAYSACAFGCVMEICKYALGNKIGPVSFIIEAGQPNSDYVERILKLTMIFYPNLKISGVKLGKKDEFLPLQSADFLAHTYSTRDQPWLKSFALSRRLYYADLSSEQLSEISVKIKAMINHQRNLRRKANKVNISEQ